MTNAWMAMLRTPLHLQPKVAATCFLSTTRPMRQRQQLTTWTQLLLKRSAAELCARELMVSSSHGEKISLPQLGLWIHPDQ
jgi:hypothetical protein